MSDQNVRDERDALRMRAVRHLIVPGVALLMVPMVAMAVMGESAWFATGEHAKNIALGFMTAGIIMLVVGNAIAATGVLREPRE